MKTLRTFLVLGFSTFMISACSEVSFKAANLPVWFSHLSIQKNISYGPDTVQKLDIYHQKNAKAPQPVIVFFYGGRWTEGKKSQYAFVGHRLAQNGYVVVIPDYAKYPDVKFPSFIEDGARAVSWVSENIEQYGGDKNNIYLSGHSSGAHIGALIVADSRYLKKYGKSPSTIKAFAGLAGPYDFIPQTEDLKDMFGPPEQYPQMQVPTFIAGNEPPMLLLHGNKDKKVILRNLDRLEKKIKEEEGIVESRIYTDINHVEIVGALSWIWQKKAPVERDMIEFFKKHESANEKL